MSKHDKGKDASKRPCAKTNACIGAACPNFVDLGLEGTDCILELPKGKMDVAAAGVPAPMGTVFL